MNIKNKTTQKSLKALEEISGEKLTLGRLLWAIRKSDELSQVEFAKKLGISKQYLCDLEHNRKTTSPKLAAIYAERLGYSREQFIRLSLQDLVDRDDLHVVVEIVSEYKSAGRRQRYAYV